MEKSLCDPSTIGLFTRFRSTIGPFFHSKNPENTSLPGPNRIVNRPPSRPSSRPSSARTEPLDSLRRCDVGGEERRTIHVETCGHISESSAFQVHSFLLFHSLGHWVDCLASKAETNLWSLHCLKEVCSYCLHLSKIFLMVNNTPLFWHFSSR